MEGKYTVIRSESPKLKDLSPDILKLYDSKMVAITKAEEAAEEAAEQIQDNLTKGIAELAIGNARDIIKIVEQGGLSLAEEESEKENKEENLEKLTKSLQESGFDLRLVKKGRRRKVE